MTSAPDADIDSSAVGSSNISTPIPPASSSMSIMVDFVAGEDEGREHAEHAATKPIISKPASARAALAAIVADATHEASPSASRTVMNTSMVDLGKSSRRNEGWMDWCTWTDVGRSSTS